MDGRGPTRTNTDGHAGTAPRGRARTWAEVAGTALALVLLAVWVAVLLFSAVTSGGAAENPILTRDMENPFGGTREGPVYDTATGLIHAEATSATWAGTATTATVALAMPWAGLSAIPTTVTAPNVTRAHIAHLADVAARATLAETATLASWATSATYATTALNALQAAAHAFYPQDVASDLAGYEKLGISPSSRVEEIDTVSVSAGLGEVLIDAYVTELGDPGVTEIPAGTWHFDTWCSRAGVAGTALIRCKVYKRAASGGAETLLFSVDTAAVTGSTAALKEPETAQGAFTVLASDRLVARYYAVSSSVAAHNMSFYHEGSSHASYIDSPILNLAIPTLDQVVNAGNNTAVNPVAFASGLTAGALANPTGTVNGTASNGTATTAMRSDGAPALANPITLPYGFKFQPASDGVAEMLFANAAGTAFITLNSTNSNLILGAGTAAQPSLQLGSDSGYGIFKEGSAISLDRAGLRISWDGQQMSGPTYSGGGALRCTAYDVTRPAHSFTGDADTGMSASAANTLVLITTGVVRQTISTTAITNALPMILPAGTATAGTAPLKFTPGTAVLLGTPELGAVEAVWNSLFYTQPAGAQRNQIVMTDGATSLTSGRITMATTKGHLEDDADFQYSRALDKMSVKNVGVSGTFHTSGTVVATATTTSTVFGISGNAHTASSAYLLGGYTAAQLLSGGAPVPTLQEVIAAGDDGGPVTNAKSLIQVAGEDEIKFLDLSTNGSLYAWQYDGGNTTYTWEITEEGEFSGNAATATTATTAATALRVDVTKVNLIGQTGQIDQTVLMPALEGQYEISYYIACDSTGELSDGVTFRLDWNDGIDRTYEAPLLSCLSAGADAYKEKTVSAYSDGSEPIYYGAMVTDSLDGATYRLRVRAKRVE